jgi:hypothetical protein
MVKAGFYTSGKKEERKSASARLHLSFQRRQRQSCFYSWLKLVGIDAVCAVNVGGITGGSFLGSLEMGSLSLIQEAIVNTK